jgi:hypothetical protein
MMTPLKPVPMPTAAAAPPPGQVLQGFKMQPQAWDQWCWIAVAASVSDFLFASTHVPAKKQCEIATTCLGFSCCPPLPPDWDGNTPGSLDAALKACDHFGGDPQEVPADDNELFSIIKTAISDGKPVGCWIYNENAPGHFVAIIGFYDNSDRDVEVRDPWDPTHDGPCPLQSMRNFFGGSWTYYIPTN